MKVSSPDILERLLRDLPSGNGQAAKGPAAGPDAFSELLKTVARRETGTNAVRADREKLAALLELVRIRMNRSVMDAFSDSDEDSTMADFSFMPARTDVAIPRQDESKVGRSHQADDIPVARGDLDGIINRASSTYGVDRNLIVSVIKAESGFDAGATSPKGAMGLMQLMPGTARDLGVTDAYDPEQNVMGGTRYLKGLLERYDGDVKKALAAYNWGAGNLERSTGYLPEETRNYIARIMEDYDRARG
ncbi:MAG TPA: lytic transglycosylase domain-containing protein [Deltaproteobacteria bacterium]|nr:lytic transglycosylase domain-containing protein [Deltaproteobacteria bacterium]